MQYRSYSTLKRGEFITSSRLRKDKYDPVPGFFFSLSFFQHTSKRSVQCQSFLSSAKEKCPYVYLIRSLLDTYDEYLGYITCSVVLPVAMILGHDSILLSKSEFCPSTNPYRSY